MQSMVRDHAGDANPMRRTFAGGQRTAAIFVLGSLAAGILNFGFHRIAAERMAEDSYAALGSVLAVLTGIGFVLTGLQLALAKVLSRDAAVGRLTHVPVAASAAGVITLLSAFLLMPGDRATVAVQAALVAGGVVAAVLGTAPRARLLATGSWAWLGLGVAAAASARVVFGTLVLGDGATLAGALFASSMGDVTGTVVVSLAARTVPVGGVVRPTRPEYRTILLGGAALAGMWALTAVDAVIARTVLDSADADRYASAAAIARIAFFAPGIAAWLAFPAFVRAPYGSLELRRAFRRAIVQVIVLSILTVVVVRLLPAPWLASLLGDRTIDRDVLGLLSIAWAILGVASLLVFFHLATDSRFALAPWIGSAIVAVGSVLVEGPTDLALLMMVGVSGMLAVLVLPALSRIRPVIHAVPARVLDLAGPVQPADLAVVVPYYNPGPIVVDTLTRVSSSLAAVTPNFQVIAVADGCTDGSDELVARADIPGLVRIVLPTNKGKGGALRAGFRLANADAVGFIDADGDLPPEQLPGFLAAMQHLDADVVAGSKNHRDSAVRMSFLRRTWSWGYQRLVRLLFRLDLRDTQTGLKLYRRELLDRVLPLLREDGFAIDLEIFVAARACGFRRFVEAPVVLDRRSTSTVSVRTVVRMLAATLAMFWRARIALAYVRSPGSQANEPEGTNPYVAVSPSEP